VHFLIVPFHENAQRSSQNTQLCMYLPDLLFQELDLKLQHGLAIVGRSQLVHESVGQAIGISGVC
jgi:hypothetical protein